MKMLSLSIVIILIALVGASSAVANKRDLPGIACASCTAISYVLHDFVSQMYQELAEANKLAKKGPGRHRKRVLDEMEISEVLDSVCDPMAVNGDWIRHYDIVAKHVSEEDDRMALTLDMHDELGQCGTECQTIALSCQRLLNDELDDRDELQELLYKNKLSSKELGDRLCRKMTKRCTLDRFLAPGYERVDEQFEVIDEKKVDMERLMAEMQAAGLGNANMFSREDMQNMPSMNEQLEMMNGMGDGYGDEF